MNYLLDIGIKYFEQMVDTIYPKELQLNTTNTSDTEASFRDLNQLIANDIISTKIDRQDGFVFDIVNFPFLMPMSLVLHSFC